MIAPCSPSPLCFEPLHPVSFLLFFILLLSLFFSLFSLSLSLSISLFLFNFLLSYAFRETLASTQIKASLADLPRCVPLTSFPPHFCRERKRCRRIRVGQRSVLLLRRGETTRRVSRKKERETIPEEVHVFLIFSTFEYAEFFNILAFFLDKQILEFLFEALNSLSFSEF